MPIIVFRGDNRDPTEIKDAGGFKAKLPLTTHAARCIIVRAAIDAGQDLSGLTGDRTSAIVKYLRDNPGLVGMRALAQAIKKETEANSIHISTELGQGGGGMGGKYIYRISCPTPLYQWGPTASYGLASPPTVLTANGDLATSPVKSYLITDTNAGNDPRNSVGAANTIAVYTYTSLLSEVAFLTEIPYGWITEYRPAAGGNWAQMP